MGLSPPSYVLCRNYKLLIKNYLNSTDLNCTLFAVEMCRKFPYIQPQNASLHIALVWENFGTYCKDLEFLLKWRPRNHSGQTKERGFNLLQEVSARKDNMYMEMIGVLPRCNTMKFQGSYLFQNVSYIPINECQVRYLEMLGTYIQ